MQEVLTKIKPSKTEEREFGKITTKFLTKLNTKLDGAKAILGGSGAKDTWLSGGHDVDIFVQFNFKKYAVQSDKLPDLLEGALRTAFPNTKMKRVHGSRDYFQFTFDKLAFEVVPILKIKKASEALNLTDISPLHSVWVNKHAKKLKDDIRLAKQFCKANGLYGAESFIGGFSGYVLEIIVVYYGSFEKLLQASLKWKPKDTIDPEKHYRNKEMVHFNLNSSKLNSPLVIVDPVDKQRNAAAALSREKFLLFKKVAKRFLAKPDACFFEKEPLTFTALKKKAEKHNLVYLEVSALKGKDDVVGVKLLKSFNFLKKELGGFDVMVSGWDWDRGKTAIFYYVLKKKELPKFVFRKGPPVSMKEHVKEFKKKNKNVKVENGQLVAKIKTPFPKLDDFVLDAIEKEYFVERVLDVKKIKVV